VKQHTRFGKPSRGADYRPGTGLARALSKLGICSRSQALERVRQGKVRVNGVVCRDPLRSVDLQKDEIELEGQPVAQLSPVYVMLNKPRGLVTTSADEQGRPTVFKILEPSGLPFVMPVGRLDKASEGLLLLTNDTQWAAAITDPAAHLKKVYHVQIDRVADADLLRRLEQGIRTEGELLSVSHATVLRTGQHNSWLEITLTEGKNRQIRRLLAAFQIQVLRLVRVAIGDLQLGDLPKGRFRHLTQTEVRSLAPKLKSAISHLKSRI
jgi:23S rRNA pseudouridine2605 synthase